MDNAVKEYIWQSSDHALKLALREANESDLINLRQWKNDQREFFFYKDEISQEQQSEWFRAYQQRPEDFMFIVLVDGIAVGCMGIRLVNGEWDVYNVILGSRNYGGKGLMGKAFRAMIEFARARHSCAITLQVLRHNPAVSWYRKNGFIVTAEHPEHFSMLYQSNSQMKDAL